MRMGNRVARLSVRLAIPLLALSVLVVGAVTPAVAARPTHNGGGAGSTTTGADVSYPQCGMTLPSFAFGIVGVNDGLANDLNPCLGPSSSYPNYTQSELYWAVTASGGQTVQPKASLYVNTADPGNIYGGKPIADWPTTSLSTDAYGSCELTTVTSRGHTYSVGADSDACAWQYGYNKALQDTVWLTNAATAINDAGGSALIPTAPANYPWWLDVESGNTWQSDTTMNLADLQGMVAGLQAGGVTTTDPIGVYSTASQWNSITGGTTSSTTSLYGAPDWIPGATTQSEAASNCALPSFTGGKVAITQWTGSPDNDFAC